MKEIIVQKITDMFDDTKLIVDIGDFRNALVEEFEKKGILSNYRNDVISAPKKGISVNGARVEKGKERNSKDHIVEDPKSVELYTEELSKQRDHAAADRAIAKEVKEMAVKQLTRLLDLLFA